MQRLKVGFSIPVYVLEYLLGKFCSTTDESQIDGGVASVKEMIKERIVRSDQGELIKARLQRFRSMKMIDMVTVTFDEKDQGGKYWAKFATSGLDKVHIAKYSPRPQTVSARSMPDDVSEDEKERRRSALDDQQAEIVAVINQQYLGKTIPVLVEEMHSDKWRGRTPQNKLVYFEDSSQDRRGQVVDVEIVWTGPWTMQGRIPGSTATPTIPLMSVGVDVEHSH